jgi:small subunit ribosomal protein S16
MVRIRLRRVGRKKAPAYRIVVADSKSPRDGKFIEIIGQYAPRQSDDQKLKIDVERVNYWMNVGAQPSDTVRALLRRAGVLKQRHEDRLGRKLQAAAVALPESAPAAE